MKKGRRCFEKLRILSLGPDVNRYNSPIFGFKCRKFCFAPKGLLSQPAEFGRAG